MSVWIVLGTMTRRDKIQLIIIYGMVLMAGLFTWYMYERWTAPIHSHEVQVKECPAGSYNINTKDEPICKLEPTGCPYGDSIPLDVCFEKFKPQTEAEFKPVENMVGK